MKIIDNKGFLHFFKWRWNIIDVLVCLFLLSFTVMFYYGYKLYHIKIIPEPKKEQVSISQEEYNKLTSIRSQYQPVIIDREEYDNLIVYRDSFLPHKPKKKLIFFRWGIEE